jgi:hypothetical protein
VATSYNIARLGCHKIDITSQYRRETRKSRSDRSVSFKGAKIPVVVLRVEELYCTIKGGSQQNQGGGDDEIVIFGVTGSGVFRRGI